MYIAQANSEVKELSVKVLSSIFYFTEHRIVSHIIYLNYIFPHPILSSYYALPLLARSATCLYLMRN